MFIPINKVKQINVLEIIRFIAAFTIFYGHYVHFFIFFDDDYTNTTFEKFLNPYGGLAVPIFFLISGFIFMHVYFKKINKSITFYQFLSRRFARLYPLHLITLFCVLVFQIFVMAHYYKPFIYYNNDAYHFLLHIFSASYWGFQTGNSFNGPFWSVSIEILLYVIFFNFVLIGRFIKIDKYLLLISPVFVALIDEFIVSSIITKCAFSYFFGCSIWLILSYISNKKPLIGTIYLFFVLTMIYKSDYYLKQHGIPFGYIGPFLIVITIYCEINISLLRSKIFTGIAKFLGELSYSSYMLHFPIQLLILLLYTYIIDVDFKSNYVLFSYILSVLVLAKLSFKFIEDPFRKKINSRSYGS